MMTKLKKMQPHNPNTKMHNVVKHEIVLFAVSVAGSIFFHEVRFNADLYSWFMTLIYFGSDGWKHLDFETELRIYAAFFWNTIIFVLIAFFLLIKILLRLEHFAKKCGHKVRRCDILSRPNILRGWKPHIRKPPAKWLQ